MRHGSRFSLWWLAALLYPAGILLAVTDPDFSRASMESFIHHFFPNLPAAMVAGIAFYGRRAFHVLIYAVLAIILINAQLATGRPKRTRGARLAVGIQSIVLAGAVATFDEVLQRYSDFRTGELLDILLDLAGIALGAFLRLRVRRRTPRKGEADAGRL
ncbi:MAG: VanZ family protein [Bacteroidota bacterium]